MKKILLAILVGFFLSACATSTQSMLDRANTVKNGMTLDEVSKIMGAAPTWPSGDSYTWAYSRSRKYSDDRPGPLTFHFKNGKTYGILSDGIYGPTRMHEIATENREAAERRSRDQEAKELADATKNRIAAERAAEVEAKRLADKAENLRLEAKLAGDAVMLCKDKLTCSKAFALTQIYINSNSNQKIQIATDTIIETYNPTEAGNIGMTAVKTPLKGVNESIQLKISCKAVADTYSEYCSKRKQDLYQNFRPFLEAGIK